MASHRFGAICDSLLTPRNMVWHRSSPTTEIMKDRNARLWYEGTTRTLFKHRYAPIANFSAQNQQVYQSLGAFGTSAMFIDQAVNAAGIPSPPCATRRARSAKCSCARTTRAWSTASSAGSA
jgi:hypothetical protein